MSNPHDTIQQHVASIREAVKVATPIAMNEGAKAFCHGIPLDWLEKLLLSHHDDHGEFAYAECAKDIKSRLIKQSNKELFSKQQTAATLAGKEGA